MRDMSTKSELIKQLKRARAKGDRPEASNANLRHANLWNADLRNANLEYANLEYANLEYANLWNADLRNANLEYAHLRNADLRNARWDGLCVDGLPSGRFLLVPTAQGWYVNQGCYRATFCDFVDMTAGDEWPESWGEEITRRRPLQQAVIALSEAHINDAEERGVIERLAEKWGETND